MSTGTSCHFGHLLQVSKKSLWSLILYQFFHDFIHVYSPGAGVDSPQGTKFWCQQKCLVISFICCKFQNNVFKVWFYTIFFHDLIHVYSPREGGIQPPRDKVLKSTETSCHFGHLLLVSIHRRQQFLKNPLFYLFSIQKHIKDQIWPCCKICQGQPRVIIWANLVVLEHPMMLSFKVIGLLVPEKKIF